MVQSEIAVAWRRDVRIAVVNIIVFDLQKFKAWIHNIKEEVHEVHVNVVQLQSYLRDARFTQDDRPKQCLYHQKYLRPQPLQSDTLRSLKPYWRSL